MPKKTASKLLAAGLTLLIAIVLLAGTTLAWFTISANPEISDIQLSIAVFETIFIARDDPEETDPLNLDFKETIDISDLLQYYTDLLPVSTVDGLHWFIPQYDSKTGDLLDPDEFIMDDKLEYANVFYVETDADGKVIYTVKTEGDVTTSSAIPLTGMDLFLAERKGYYVYTDIWLKTNAEEGADVRLAYPDYGTSRLRTNRELDRWFGTYVLPIYKTDEVNGETVIKKISRNAESSVRVGFQILGTDPAKKKGTASDSWFIFEPNADLRSDYVNKPAEYGDYVANYSISSSAYSNGIYIETRPIGYNGTMIGETDADGNPVWTYTAVSDSAVYSANNGQDLFYVQTASGYDEITGSEALALDPAAICYTRTQKQRLRAVPCNLDTNKLIVQLAGEWDMDNASTQAKVLSDPMIPFNSNDVKTFGKFISTAGLYQKLTNLRADVATDACIIPSSASIFDCGGSDPRASDSLPTTNYSNHVLLHLNYEEPVKIRVFVWVEGQDPDCWNDIAAGGFRMNVEFAGYVGH